MADKPILDLTTLDPAKRPFIRIDRKRYDLNTPADFGIGQLAILDGLQKELAAVKPRRGQKRLTGPQVATVARILRRALGLVVRELPDEVSDKLTEPQKMAVIDSFTLASARTKPTRPNRAARRSTGASTSRASAGSMASTSG